MNAVVSQHYFDISFLTRDILLERVNCSINEYLYERLDSLISRESLYLSFDNNSIKNYIDFIINNVFENTDISVKGYYILIKSYDFLKDDVMKNNLYNEFINKNRNNNTSNYFLYKAKIHYLFSEKKEFLKDIKKIMSLKDELPTKQLFILTDIFLKFDLISLAYEIIELLDTKISEYKEYNTLLKIMCKYNLDNSHREEIYKNCLYKNNETEKQDNNEYIAYNDINAKFLWRNYFDKSTTDLNTINPENLNSNFRKIIDDVKKYLVYFNNREKAQEIVNFLDNINLGIFYYEDDINENNSYLSSKESAENVANIYNQSKSDKEAEEQLSKSKKTVHFPITNIYNLQFYLNFCIKYKFYNEDKAKKIINDASQALTCHVKQKKFINDQYLNCVSHVIKLYNTAGYFEEAKNFLIKIINYICNYSGKIIYIYDYILTVCLYNIEGYFVSGNFEKKIDYTEDIVKNLILYFPEDAKKYLKYSSLSNLKNFVDKNINIDKQSDEELYDTIKIAKNKLLEKYIFFSNIHYCCDLFFLTADQIIVEMMHYLLLKDKINELLTFFDKIFYYLRLSDKSTIKSLISLIEIVKNGSAWLPSEVDYNNIIMKMLNSE